jgi:hypothetical protein
MAPSNAVAILFAATENQKSEGKNAMDVRPF